jgi:hypothetical protein
MPKDRSYEATGRKNMILVEVQDGAKDVGIIQLLFKNMT